MFHPFFYAVARREAKAKARSAGFGRFAVNDAMDDIDNDVIDHVSESVGGVPVGALGDGKIIQAILDFFKSPQGQALIDALLKMLLGLLAGL